jgi:catechol 2,3-dioxygenase-like lactoylglutathione lyase family enzyme
VTDPSLHHVGVTVSDLNRAVDFYTDTFDLTIVAEFAVGGAAFAEAVDVAGASATFTHLDGDGARVELPPRARRRRRRRVLRRPRRRRRDAEPAPHDRERDDDLFRV